MKKLIIYFFLFPFFSFAQNKILAIRNIAVIDVVNNRTDREKTIVITGNRIAAIGNKIAIPKTATIIDGKGKYIMPGLWDMHVHDICDAKWGKTVFMPLFLVNGITGVRDMGGPDSGSPEVVYKTRQEIEAGKILGPRIIAAGYFIMGNVWGPREVIKVSNDSDARHAVDFIKNAGADFIKVKELVPREAYFAIADQANRQHIALAGHVPFLIDAAEAAKAGQRSIEHLDGIWFACSTEGERLRSEAFDAEFKMFLGKNSQSNSFRTITYALDTAIKSYSASKAKSLFRQFVLSHTYVCPTLTISRALANSADTSFQNDVRLNYIPASIARGWNPAMNGRLQQFNSTDFAALYESFQKSLQLVKAMTKAGVKLLAGTDTSPKPSSIPYLFPGFSLIDELELYVQAGLTPSEALQTATINASQFLGLENKYGTVSANKTADLVVLEANPLDDIKNIAKINAVIINGRWISKTELQQMLKNAETAAKK